MRSSGSQSWGRVGIVLTVGLVLLLAAPGPSEAVHDLSRPAAGDLAGPVVALASLLADGLAAWLLLVALLTGGSRLAGPFGRACDAVARRTAPLAVRRAVALTLGVGVALGSAGTASAAGAAPRPAAAVASAATSAPAVPQLGSLDWPVPPAPGGTPAPGAPNPVGTPAAVGAPNPVGTSPPVVVRPGDTLWGLASRALPPGASPAQIAVAWPSWWQANRHVIGDDPDLLRPGQQLRPPAG